MVLEGDKRQGKTGMAVEEEDQGEIESLDASGISASSACGEIGQASIGSLLIGGAEELIIQSIPVGINFIYLLTTDFELDFGDKLFGGEVGGGGSALLESDFQEHGRNEVTITRDGSGHALTVVHGPVEGLFDGFEGKVGMSAVNNLPESYGR